MQEKLMILRKKRGLSIKEIADFLDIDQQTYSKKERGIYEFTQDEMFFLRDFFGLNMDQIFLPRSHQNGDKVTI